MQQFEKRQLIYDGLKKHYGSQTRLANEQGVSREWVRMVLNGERDDEDLVLAASKLWHKLEKEKADKLRESAKYADMAAELSISN